MTVKELKSIKELIKEGTNCIIHAYDKECNELQVNKTKIRNFVYAMFDNFEIYSSKDMLCYESDTNSFSVVISNYEFIFDMLEIKVYYNNI